MNDAELNVNIIRKMIDNFIAYKEILDFKKFI